MQAQTRRMKLADDVDFDQIAAMLPPNFTGADFSALTTESYMLAVKEKIEVVKKDIDAYKVEAGMSPTAELLPETYFKLKF